MVLVGALLVLCDMDAKLLRQRPADLHLLRYGKELVCEVLV